jgi:hypothetical protein
MPEPSLYRLFTDKLNRLGVRYMVTGSVAAMIYGEPRLTNGVDLVVFTGRDEIARLAEAFSESEFYFPPAEVIGVELARERGGHFKIIHHKSGHKADVYLGGSDPFHAWALSRARRLDAEGETLMVAPAEYVIVRKLEYFRDGGSGVGRRLDSRGANSRARVAVGLAASSAVKVVFSNRRSQPSVKRETPGQPQCGRPGVLQCARGTYRRAGRER